jgi:hypothetical protein
LLILSQKRPFLNKNFIIVYRLSNIYNYEYNLINHKGGNMKKISIVSILSVLVLPAFAQTDVKHLYGDPANIKQNITPNADLQQVAEPQPEAQQIKEQAVNSKEITEEKIEETKVEEKHVEEQKTEKQTKKTSQSKEKQQEVQEEQLSNTSKVEKQKFETKSNPDAKFPKGLQFGLGVSPTSGLNAFIGYNNKKFDSFWWKRFGFRLDFATYSPIKNKLNREINDTIGNDGIKIDDNLKVNNVNLNAKHIGAFVDFYPFGDTWFLGGWRISGGYMTGNMDLNADIVGTKKVGEIEFELGGRKYKYDGDSMRGKSNVNWKYSGPYLGTGFDLGIFRGFKLYLDAGVVFADKNAKVNLDVPITSDLKDITSGAPQDISGAIETKFEEAKAKALAEAQDELDKVDYYPIVKLGFMYRF